MRNHCGNHGNAVESLRPSPVLPPEKRTALGTIVPYSCPNPVR
jgi:hypothetical protein